MMDCLVVAIRITADADPAYAKSLEWMRRHSLRHFAVEHNADADCGKPHAHLLCWLVGARRVESYRDAYKKFVKPEGNRQYSLKVSTDPSAMERYMCHAEAEGCTVKVLAAQPPADDPARYSAVWCRAQNEAFYAARKDRAVTRKMKDVPLWKRVVAECKDEGICAASPHAVADVLFNIMSKDERLFNAYIVRAQFQTALFHLDGTGGGEYRRTLVDWITRPLN